MTTANIVTVLRILMVPFFVVQMLYFIQNGNQVHRLLGLLSFAVAAISDGIDGYIARRYNQKTELGAILDPLADKLLLVSAVLLLTLGDSPHLHRFPLWLTGIIIGRDVILILGLGILHFTFGTIKVRPKLTGKVSTVLQMSVVLWSLLLWPKPMFNYICIAAAIFTIAAGLQYIFDGLRQLSKSPSSTPSSLE